MKKRYLVIFLLLLGCSSIRTTKTLTDKSGAGFSSSYAGTENGIPYYYCDSFAVNALNRYSFDYLKTIFSEDKNIVKTPIQNIHDTTVIDTIYTFSDKNNTVEYYKGAYANFITKIEVTDNKYALHGGISTGKSKALFRSVFNVSEEFGNIIQVGNKNKTAVYTFYFKNSKIHKIQSNLYVD